jgi:predicted transcriptional regulator
MTTLRIEIDEAIAAAIQEKASRSGKTPEAWAAELVTEQIQLQSQRQRAWVEEFLAATASPKGDSGGRKWSRDELYDD